FQQPPGFALRGLYLNSVAPKAFRNKHGQALCTQQSIYVEVVVPRKINEQRTLRNTESGLDGLRVTFVCKGFESRRAGSQKDTKVSRRPMEPLRESEVLLVLLLFAVIGIGAIVATHYLLRDWELRPLLLGAIRD